MPYLHSLRALPPPRPTSPDLPPSPSPSPALRVAVPPRRLGFPPPCAPVSALPPPVAPVLVRPGVPAPSLGGSSTRALRCPRSVPQAALVPWCPCALPPPAAPVPVRPGVPAGKLQPLLLHSCYTTTTTTLFCHPCTYPVYHCQRMHLYSKKHSIVS